MVKNGLLWVIVVTSTGSFLDFHSWAQIAAVTMHFIMLEGKFFVGELQPYSYWIYPVLLVGLSSRFEADLRLFARRRATVDWKVCLSCS